MNSSLKRLHVAFVLAVVLALLLVQVPKAYSAELAAPEKALTFLKDVVKLDMTKYTATLGSYRDYPPDSGGISVVYLKYTLTSAGSKLDVICRFINNSLVYCPTQRTRNPENLIRCIHTGKFNYTLTKFTQA
ncbi:MAG: hypothetical protein QW146_07580 [Candidatus Bathyarchaeia archaeon]